MPSKKTLIGLVDADLLSKGTRHPNLALLKIAGLLYENEVPFELILDQNADIKKYRLIYMSKVFTFSKEPSFYTNATANEKKKFRIGGTGYYANESSISVFTKKRNEDMARLEKDSYLNTLTNSQGTNGIIMSSQMPFYGLYDDYISKEIASGKSKDKYKDYQNFSIGFLTRKCYRHCPFCVNRLENGVVKYSELEWFLDKTRHHVYFWDDNFLAAPYEIWKPALKYLIDNKISFQFRQGLDERQIAENGHGEEMAQMLAQANYYGDYIFAFDNWKDRFVIEKALKIWKKYAPKKGTKFYLFCGYKQEEDNKQRFYQDIWELFQRLKILMQYGCVGYVMRHDDYHKAPISNLYIQIARWCNQQQFYKKMSFWEFTYRNQSYWEEHSSSPTNRPKLISYERFEKDYNDGIYNNIKMCLPLKTLVDTLAMFPEHKEELLEMFNYKMLNLINPTLWE